MTARHLIYGLVDPRTNELRYVGRSSLGFNRARTEHSSHCGNWIKNLKALDLNPLIVTLEEFELTHDVDDVLNVAERKWIAYHRSVGARLTNLTDGGEMGRKFLPEVREKMSLAHSGEKNHFFGKKHDANALMKMRSSVICLDDGKIFPGLNIAAEYYGIASSSLCLVCQGKRNKTGGRRFAYASA